MPELPEVETIRNNLRLGVEDWPSVLNRRILEAGVTWERTLATHSPEHFAAQIRGQSIEEIGRRGKFLIFHLSRDHLLVHLRMSGDMVVEPRPAPVGPHHRMMLDLEGEVRLSFVDARKFGRVWLVDDPARVLNGLGPEPFSPDLTPERFHAMLRGRKRLLKPLLLDQTFIAGMGNIYTDEALNLARLHPLQRSDRLNEAQSAALLESIRTVLQEGIRLHGASIDWVYRGGDFQNSFRVYQRTGLECPRCGSRIQRILVGQRGTHYCPTCQPPPGG